MAITIENVNSASNKETNTITYSLNIGTANNRAWIICCTWGGINTTVQSVTVGTDTLTSSTTLQNSGNKAFAQIFYGTTGLTGAQTVTVTFNASPKFICMGGYALSGVDQTTPVENESGNASAVGTSISTSLSGGAADSLGLDGLFDNGTSNASTSDNTNQYTANIESTHGQGSSAVGAAPTMGYTSMSNNKDHAISAVLIKAFTAAGGVSIHPDQLIIHSL